MEFIEKVVEGDISALAETVKSIGQSKVYELLIVGKGQFPLLSMGSQLNQIDQAEMGTIGDALASPHAGISSSVIVIQHQQLPNANNSTAPKNKDRNQELSLV